MFGGCIADGNNALLKINSGVSVLFGGDGISLDPALSYYQGAPDPVKAGTEFIGDRASVGFDATDGFTGGAAVEFFSLSDDTLFVTLKASTGFTLYSAADFLGMTFESGVTNNNGKGYQQHPNLWRYNARHHADQGWDEWRPRDAILRVRASRRLAAAISRGPGDPAAMAVGFSCAVGLSDTTRLEIASAAVLCCGSCASPPSASP